jgi:hypothetical protein
MSDPVPADPAATPATTRVARRSTQGPGAGGLAARIILTVLGAAGMIVGAFTAWLKRANSGSVAQQAQSAARGGRLRGTHLSLKALFDLNALLRPGHFYKSVGVAMIVLALIALIGLAPRSGWLTRIAALLGVVVVALFAISVIRSPRVKIANIGLGAWLAVVGSVVALVGGFFGTRAKVVEERVATTAPPP